ncbi:MAG: JAB domain-containing protein [Gammaproteobacteria bacterium]|uniref:DNA repair protein RadC n=1 Tax=endosymbiont of Bathymodiolus septemdierum str. Myojin knoll TaxID=1303921 RepID=A0A0P0UQZ4_9GAMM|nr:DNA repair protein RadC [Bathymodiolus septemdierum thioautotrophic gill symbiont]RUA05854.1 MAG: JAB domain-containing protein [Gammaproteobacteria bacterium]BAS67513.1 DNA repair protein RadC [endosymbiont of Bathymodiolus septemdierum str. Myojin knoll]
MSITDWHENDRPREKLIKFGAKSLTDAELLAIFLRVGVKGKSAVELAQELINQFGSLNNLLMASEEEFCQGKGLGVAKYAGLQGVLEMAKRHFESGLKKGDVFTNPEQIANYLHLHIGNSSRETFAVMLLDQKHHLIELVSLFTGTVNQASVHPREVLKLVLMKNASAVVLAHNHPSGDPMPSQADIDITQKIRQALALIDVRMLDHIIIGNKGQFESLAQSGNI